MRVIAEAGNGAEALQRCNELHPDIVLMDLAMPHMGGIEAMREIRRGMPEIRIVVLTTYRGDAQATSALEAGASGYLLKSMLRKDLVDTIRLVQAGKRCIPAEIATEIAAHIGDDTLSPREIEVLTLVAAGNPNKRVASHLGVTEDTAKAHMKNILLKLGARDRTHAVTIAIKRGIVNL
jgi:DNA-binding NarL/FixJ family response regulator